MPALRTAEFQKLRLSSLTRSAVSAANGDVAWVKAPGPFWIYGLLGSLILDAQQRPGGNWPLYNLRGADPGRLYGSVPYVKLF